MVVRTVELVKGLTLNLETEGFVNGSLTETGVWEAVQIQNLHDLLVERYATLF